MSLPPFQHLLEEHASSVLSFLHAVAGPDQADDCFQETFLAALRAYPSLRSARNLRAWLFTIAHNKAMDAHRGRARRPVPSAVTPEVAVDAHTPQDDALWGAVAELPPKQRAAVTLRYRADLTHSEIGTALGISEAAARRNVFEGLQRLREEVTP